MSKANVRNIIKQRKLSKFAKLGSDIETANNLFATLENNFGLAATVGITAAEFLCTLRDGKLPNDKDELITFLSELVNEKMYEIHDIFPDALPRPLAIRPLVIATMHLLANADLLTGIIAPLTPVYKNGKLNFEIALTGEDITITDRGNKFADKAFSGTNIFANPDIYGQTFYDLSLGAIKYIVEKLSK